MAGADQIGHVDRGIRLGLIRGQQHPQPIRQTVFRDPFDAGALCDAGRQCLIRLFGRGSRRGRVTRVGRLEEYAGRHENKDKRPLEEAVQKPWTFLSEQCHGFLMDYLDSRRMARSSPSMVMGNMRSCMMSRSMAMDCRYCQ